MIGVSISVFVPQHHHHRSCDFIQLSVPRLVKKDLLTSIDCRGGSLARLRAQRRRERKYKCKSVKHDLTLLSTCTLFAPFPRDKNMMVTEVRTIK